MLLPLTVLEERRNDHRAAAEITSGRGRGGSRASVGAGAQHRSAKASQRFPAPAPWASPSWASCLRWELGAGYN